MIKIKKIYKNLYIIKSNSRKELVMTILRFQEYYESPKFKNKIFSLKDFITWYRSVNNNKFTYVFDYCGFNFPSYVLKPFYKNKFKDITKNERKVLDFFKNINGNFYIIASVNNDITTLKHELAHYFWRYNKAYKRKIKTILNKIPNREILKLKRVLKNEDYHESIILDEIHAYLTIESSSHPILLTANININSEILKLLKLTFNKYYNKL